MSLARIQMVLTAAGTIAAAVALYYIYRKLDTGAKEATKPLADFWFNLTAPAAVKQLSAIRLPNGQTADLDPIIKGGGRTEWKNGTLYLYWGSRAYELSGRDSEGYYIAKEI